jgi:hypothetical protein
MSICQVFFRILQIVAVGALGGSAQAYELTLPALGTDINYNFHTGVPEFQISESIKTPQVLVGELLFAKGKALRLVVEGDDSPLVVYMELQGEGILDLFEDVFLGFDESLALLDADGLILAESPKNYSVGYNPDLGDSYQYGWDFNGIRDMSGLTIYGMQWNITPNLKPGKSLPDQLGLAWKVWTAGMIYVVPEPANIIMIGVAVVMIGLCRCPTGIKRSRGWHEWEKLDHEA